ncbi:hypothetical protein WJX72_010617 [[Myrmecia] bisecta]|uniref:Uncharacterized protein n=1 Tax=[Myrmecia] bisecta TaxID=41462 RepID=A0AAW1QTA9_9CHLO
MPDADAVLAEDTRHSRKLLTHLGISTPLISFHTHNEAARQNKVLERLDAGAALALISDAGMPAISDPGADLVAAVVQAGHRVIPIPGPSAVLSALVASGLSTSEFLFAGFLPPKAGARKKRLQELADVTATLILYAPPHSLVAILADAAGVLGSQRRCAVARELTKLHEEVYRDTLEGAHAEFMQRAPKGEVTLVIEGASQALVQLSDVEVETLLRQAMQDGESASRAAKLVAESHSVSRKAAYELAMKVQDGLRADAGSGA